MRRTISLALISAVAVGGLLVGCGSESSTLPEATTTVPASGDTTGGEPTDGTTVFTGDADSDYCQLVRQYDEQSTIFDDLFTTETPDPAKLKVAFETMQGLIDELVAIAPDEVKADAATMGQATSTMIGLMAQYDYDFTKLLASSDAAALNELFANADVAAASDRLDQYDQQVCGVSYDS